jgi:hypothetical protein
VKRYASPVAGNLLDHSAAHPFVERLEEVALVQAGGAPDHLERELGPGHACHLEDVPGRLGEPGESLAHHLAHALRARELAGFDQRPPQLDHKKCVAVGQVADAARELLGGGVGIFSAGPAHELGDFLVAEPAQSKPLDALHAAQIDERLG